MKKTLKDTFFLDRPDNAALRRLNEQEAEWKMHYPTVVALRIGRGPVSTFDMQRVEYARRRGEQLSDQDFRQRVFEDMQKHELLGDHAGFSGHRDTWQGSDDLEAVPPQRAGGNVLVWSWKGPFSGHSAEPQTEWRREFEAGIETPQDLLARVLRRSEYSDAYGEVEWPDVPTFYFGNNGEKIEEDKLVAIVEECRGMIFRGIDEAIHLLGDDTFG